MAQSGQGNIEKEKKLTTATRPDYVSPAFDEIADFVRKKDPSASEGAVALYICVVYTLYCIDKKDYIRDQLSFYNADKEDKSIKYSYMRFANDRKYTEYYSQAEQNLRSYLSIQLRAAINEAVQENSKSFRNDLAEVEATLKKEIDKSDRGVIKEALFHILSVVVTFTIPVVIIIILSIFRSESFVETTSNFADWLISIGNKIHQTIHQ